MLIKSKITIRLSSASTTANSSKLITSPKKSIKCFLPFWLLLKLSLPSNSLSCKTYMNFMTIGFFLRLILSLNVKPAPFPKYIPWSKVLFNHPLKEIPSSLPINIISNFWWIGWAMSPIHRISMWRPWFNVFSEGSWYCSRILFFLSLQQHSPPSKNKLEDTINLWTSSWNQNYCLLQPW